MRMGVAVTAAVLGGAVTTCATLTHKWDTVGDGLFGWLGPPYTDEVIEFYVEHYGLIVIGGATTCNASDPGSSDSFEAARMLRQKKPGLTILLYEATGFGALCLGSKEMLLHPEWWLRDDHGAVFNRTAHLENRTVNLGPLSIDWRIPEARQWWVTTVMQAHDGATLFDGLLVDSAGPSVHLDNTTHFVTKATEKALVQAKMDMLGEAKAYFSQLNGGEVIGNPTLEWGVVGYPDREAEQPFSDPHYHWQYLTGTLDEMFGGFGTQNSDDGSWNATMMNMSITAIVESTTKLNATVLVRGYPGPCSIPFLSLNASCVGEDKCPTMGPNAGMKHITVPQWAAGWPEPQPTTVEEFQEAAVRLLPQALAPYLILAGPSTWWSYAYFYGADSGWYVCKNNPKSCIAPQGWYPELAQKLGAPLGPATNKGWTWTREFEYASASIDLQDRTASKVTFHTGDKRPAAAKASATAVVDRQCTVEPQQWSSLLDEWRSVTVL